MAPRSEIITAVGTAIAAAIAVGALVVSVLAYVAASDSARATEDSRDISRDALALARGADQRCVHVSGPVTSGGKPYPDRTTTAIPDPTFRSTAAPDRFAG